MRQDLEEKRPMRLVVYRVTTDEENKKLTFEEKFLIQENLMSCSVSGIL